MTKPDAVIIPAGFIPHPIAGTRVAKTFDFLEAILGADRAKGERVWAHKQPPTNYLFCAIDRRATMFFAKDHPKAGQPRYRWEDRPGGLRIGTLIDE